MMQQNCTRILCLCLSVCLAGTGPVILENNRQFKYLDGQGFPHTCCICPLKYINDYRYVVRECQEKNHHLPAWCNCDVGTIPACPKIENNDTILVNCTDSYHVYSTCYTRCKQDSSSDRFEILTCGEKLRWNRISIKVNCQPKPRPKPEIKACPKIENNDTILVNCTDSYHVYSTCYTRCKQDSSSDRFEILTCGEKLRWNRISIKVNCQPKPRPKPEIKGCSVINNLTNGQIQCTSDKCNAVCASNFILSGSSTLECVAGEWNDSWPACHQQISDGLAVNNNLGALGALLLLPVIGIGLYFQSKRRKKVAERNPAEKGDIELEKKDLLKKPKPTPQPPVCTEKISRAEPEGASLIDCLEVLLCNKEMKKRCSDGGKILWPKGKMLVLQVNYLQENVKVTGLNIKHGNNIIIKEKKCHCYEKIGDENYGPYELNIKLNNNEHVTYRFELAEYKDENTLVKMV